MNHWIFVIKDDERVFDLRIKQKKWPIYPATKFQKYLKIGDIIVFYRAGKYGQYFLGTALVNSKVKPTPDEIDLHIDIDKIDVWKERLSIRGMLSQLSKELKKKKPKKNEKRNESNPDAVNQVFYCSFFVFVLPNNITYQSGYYPEKEMPHIPYLTWI